MTTKEAKRLLIGTVVMWDGDKDDLGTVRKLSDAAFYVDWANGQRGWIDFRDASKIAIR
jgi:hypothetical protein